MKLKIPSQLFSKEQAAALKLQDQPYIILIPKSILQKYGIISDNVDFDFTIINNKITLVGPLIPNPRVSRHPKLEECHNE